MSVLTEYRGWRLVPAEGYEGAIWEALPPHELDEDSWHRLTRKVGMEGDGSLGYIGFCFGRNKAAEAYWYIDLIEAEIAQQTLAALRAVRE